MTNHTTDRLLKLGVNIDHVATLRQARYALLPDLPNAEPSLLAAANSAIDSTSRATGSVLNRSWFNGVA